MKKLFPIAFFSAALMFVACGDDSSSGPEEESSSSIEVEDESSSSVEEEGKSSSSEAKKGDSSSSEEATSSSSAAVSSSSHYSTEPKCTISTEDNVLSGECTYYGTETGDVKFVTVVDYVKNTWTLSSQGSLFHFGSCSMLKTWLKKRPVVALSCSDAEKYYDVTINYVDGIEKEVGTIEEFVPVVREFFESGLAYGTETLNQKMLENGAYGTFRDTRDAKLYHTIKVDGQIWMAQNMNYGSKSGSSCYDNDVEYCVTYGRLYTWEAAKSACPTGWRLPTSTEWETLLVTTMGATKDESGQSYSGNDISLLGGGSYANSYGLSFVLGGAYGEPGDETPEYNSRGSSGVYWLGDEPQEGNVPVISIELQNTLIMGPDGLPMIQSSEGVYLYVIPESGLALSVRCIKD
ncbi:MAG: hypothetical protein MJY47_08430 [Fibrobacter sp.]|nr:hypothetical protein [Fibrobacter sp.]